MRPDPFSRFCVLVLVLAMPALIAEAQTKPAPAKWSAPRTPDGQPDLQGVWTNATITPLERPAAMAGKAFLTEAEAAAHRKAHGRQPRRVGQVRAARIRQLQPVLVRRWHEGVVHAPDVAGGRSTRRARAGPAVRRSETRRLRGAQRRQLRVHEPVGPLHHARHSRLDVSRRLQQRLPDHPDARLRHDRLRDDPRRPHHPARQQARRAHRARIWMGDSRGHWEGDTLVVETTNYNNKGWITTSAASGRIKGIPHTEQLHVVERFTRVAADKISYSSDDRRSRHLHQAVDGVVSADRGSGVPHLRVRVPRGELRDREYPARRAGAGEGREAAEVGRSPFDSHSESQIRNARSGLRGQRKRQQRRPRRNQHKLPPIEQIRHRRRAPDRRARRVPPQVLAGARRRTP